MRWNMKDNTYNGWYNYATWRVYLEIFDGMEIEEPYTWEMCKDYVEDIIHLGTRDPDSLLDRSVPACRFSIALGFDAVGQLVSAPSRRR